MSRLPSFATIILALVAVFLSGHSSDAASAEIDSSGVSSSRTLNEVIKSQRRFVLYNSRQLSGECLDICVPDVRTDPPVQTQTKEPTNEPTKSPTKEPTKSPTKEPTKAPTKEPTKKPTKEPTKEPTEEPTKKPTKEPTKAPTKEPTKKPTKSPTSKPTDVTASPTSSPSSSPVCHHKKTISVCVAIDDSGSVCSVDSPTVCSNKCHQSKCQAGGTDLERGEHGSCCGNYETVQNFATDYIGALGADGTTVSVVKFSDTSVTIADKENSVDAILAINEGGYYGGYTNTEQAIHECTKMIKDDENPVIVLVTDGTPTACTKRNSNNRIRHGMDNCKTNSCNCEYGNTATNAAYDRADYAASEGVTVVPVVIQSVSSNIDILQKLARCPDNDDSCNTEDFMGLHVNEISEMGEVLDSLIELTGCEDDEPEPICTDTKAIDVCIAIDNSGSVCTTEGNPKLCQNGCDSSDCQANGFLGGNSCCQNYHTVQKFATDYIEAIDDTDGTVSVVTFASEADVLYPSGTGADAIVEINGNEYSGGFTATEAAIIKCANQVKDKENPVIILITDGTPTACRAKHGGGYLNHGDQGCDKNNCDCKKGGNPRIAAQNSANWAANQSVTVVPVVISSVSTDLDYLQSLARCPKNGDSSCDTDNFKGLHVNEISEMGEILDSLIKLTGCEENA